jgi:hypothetical protein
VARQQLAGFRIHDEWGIDPFVTPGRESVSSSTLFGQVDRLTRRTLMRQGGVALGAAGALSLAGTGPIANALAAVAGDGLPEASRHTYAALIETLAAADAAPVHARRLGASTDAFAAWYDGCPAEQQANVDGVLALLEEGVPGGFSNVAVRARLRMLRRWIYDDARGKSDGYPHGLLATAAIGYAAVPFREDVEGPLPLPLP